jgi:hypothetical protein
VNRIDLSDFESVISDARQYAESLKRRGGADNYDAGRGIDADVVRARQTLNELYRRLPALLDLERSAHRAYDIYVTSQQDGCSCHVSAPCNWCVNQPDPDAEVEPS